MIDVSATGNVYEQPENQFYTPAVIGEVANFTATFGGSGSPGNIRWEANGEPCGSGASFTVPILHCGIISLAGICICTNTVVWTGILYVRCPKVKRVGQQDAEPEDRPWDSQKPENKFEYFKVIRRTGTVTLVAELERPDDVPEDAWTALDWDKTLHWEAVSDRDGSTYTAVDKRISLPRDTVCTFKVTIHCCDEELWKGKVEVYQFEPSPPPEKKSPDNGSPSCSAAPATGSTPGAYSPPNGSTGAFSPMLAAGAAGPDAFFGSSGQLAQQMTMPGGASMSFPPYGAMQGTKKFDTASGYGTTQSFTRQIFRERLLSLDNVYLFGPNGSVLYYTNKDSSGLYIAPDSATSTLKWQGVGWLETSLVDNQSWTYDQDGNLTGMKKGATQWVCSPTIINGFPLPGSIANPSGQALTLTYGGGEDESNPPRLDAVIDESGRTTTFDYDAKNLSGQTSPGVGNQTLGYTDGLLTSYTLPGGNTYSYGYDAQERVTLSSTPLGNSTTYEYPSAHQRVIIDPLGRRTTVTYDGVGNITEIQRGGKTWSYSYTGGHLSSLTDPNGNVIGSAYATSGSNIYRLDAVGNGAGQTAHYAYGDDGMVAAIQDFRGLRTSFIWDAHHNRTALLDAAGRRVTYAYDGQGQITRMTDKLGREFANVYDLVGDRIAAVSPSGLRTTYTYNANHQVASHTDRRN